MTDAQATELIEVLGQMESSLDMVAAMLLAIWLVLLIRMIATIIKQ